MKKHIAACILLVFFAIPFVVADSSINTDVTIGENLYFAFEFTEVEPQLYSEIKTQGFNVSTIPNAVKENFEQQNLANARVIYDLNQEIFNDTMLSIDVGFHITGSDIISYVLNKTDITRTFRVRTDWRKFQVSFTQNFSLNFEEHFGVSLTEWQQTKHTTANGENHPAFERKIEDPFEMSFRFILPEKAVAVQVENDTIIFKVPLAFEDTLLNSPFLILGALVIANIIVVAYRKAKK